ncbi:hypothetical protein B0H11DRAFT_1906704 [Mycena galericulata]|nr:hypothetical protein B0H11DRAFT_1906704 [Mycena galericulata]
MSTGNVPLRILFTLNGSAQYILARSQGVVSVEFIHFQGNSASSSSSTPPRYASVSLKTCLDTICRSCPEIIQDRSRDFSVYLLDPLETDCAPAQVSISHPSVADAPEARVAVGLGLMSWALMADEADTVSATGTLKVSSSGKEMLEVIFSLRETAAMQKTELPDALRSWGLPSTTASSKQKGKRPAAYPPPRRKRVTPPKPPPIPIPLTSEADKLLAVCDPYIGPERRPAGRPLKEWPAIRPDDDDDIVVVAHHPPAGSSSHLDQTNNQPVQAPSPLLDFLAFLKAISPDTDRNKALGNVLGLVHGSDGTAVHPPPELADAMTLFAEFRRAPPLARSQSQPDSTPSSHSQHRRKSSSTDDEIVVLNKENVNPAIFRRRERDAKLLSAVESSATASHTPISQEASTLMPSNQLPTRKRTLSDFMGEQESAREKENAQKRYYRQPERSMSEGGPSRATDSTAPAATIGSVDPPKPKPSRTRRTISCTSSPDSSFLKEPSAPPKLAVSASSPPRPPRKKYVVPAWARTETATQPRLSERAQQKEQEKKKELKEEEKRKRDLRRKQARDENGRPSEGKYPKLGRGPPAAASESSLAPVAAPGAKVSPLPAPVAASGEFPVFSEAVEKPSAAPFPLRPPRTPSPNNHPPCTPPQIRHVSTSATPGAPNSLFTPASASWEARGALDLVRRSMSPSLRKASTQDSRPAQCLGGPESEEEDLLGQELDSAFNEFDFPPSSLPVASSDIEVDVETNQMPSSSPEYDSDDSDDADVPPKQHWVGLPPSSPPPPSSPYLTGSFPMDDDDVEESPLTAPDTDAGSEVETPDTEVINYSEEELGKLLNIDDLTNFFPTPGVDSIDTASLFDQFTNYNFEPSSDDTAQTMKDWGLDVTVAATNPDFDFTEFWESVKPLVENSSQLDTNSDFGHFNPGDMDNAKLAGDVHALFSGCLV